MSGIFGGLIAATAILMYGGQLVALAAALLAWGTGMGMRPAVMLVLAASGVLGYAALKRHRRREA